MSQDVSLWGMLPCARRERPVISGARGDRAEIQRDEGSRVDELLTTRQVAEALGVTRRTVDRWVASGRLPVAMVTPSGRRRYSVSAVTQAGQPVQAAEPAQQPAQQAAEPAQQSAQQAERPAQSVVRSLW